MANGRTRVTVVSPDRRVDLSLPESVQLGELMGQLLDMCTEHHDRSAPIPWALRPVGGTALALGSTLESSQVLDGSVLELLPRSEAAPPTIVEDVRDATEDVVDQTLGAWNSRDSTTLALLIVTVLAVVLLARPTLWTGVPGNGSAVAGALAGALLYATVRIARQGLTVAAHGLLAVGLAWTAAVALAGQVALAAADLTAATRAVVCSASVLAAATAVTWAVPRLGAWVAAVAVGALASVGWLAMDLAGGSPDQAIALGTVVGVLGIGLLPRVSLAAGGLAGLDYIVRTRGGIDPGTVTAAFARSRSLLNGALVGTAALTAAGAVRLAIAGSPVQLALAGMIACCLLLRARAFSQRLHVWILGLAGVGSLLAQLTSDLTGDEPRPTTFVALLLLAAGSILLARGGMSEHTNDVAKARGRRLLDLVESLAIATLIPLLAANLGVLDWLRGLVD